MISNWEMDMFSIHWRNRTTGHEGRGEFAFDSPEIVDAAVRALNKACPGIEHWVVEQPAMRRVAAVHLLVPKYPSFGVRPWHTPIVELHLLGVERTQFRNEFSSARYNYYARFETLAHKMGLVSTISMN
jgi:hypothetical protein